MKLWILLLISLFLEVAFTKECASPSDCGPNECCVLGMERYSIPQCEKRGEEGKWCRAGAVPEDRMLFYPNQDVKDVKGVYTLFCPCADGYNCVHAKCRHANTTRVKFPRPLVKKFPIH